MPPSPLIFFQFGICVVITLVFAYLFSLVTERHTHRFRKWLRTAIKSRSADRLNP